MKKIIYMYHGTSYENWLKIKKEGLKATYLQTISLAPDIETAEQYAKQVTQYGYNSNSTPIYRHGVVIRVKLDTTSEYFKNNSERIYYLTEVLKTSWKNRDNYFPEYVYYESIPPKDIKLIKQINCL